MRLTATLARVLALSIVSMLCLGVLVVAIGGAKPSGPHYTARFTDASALLVHADVRAAGVIVGEVTSIDVAPDNLVNIEFDVQPGVPMTTTTHARIRFADLIGTKYLELYPGTGQGRSIPAGAIIPVGRTSPALDLDELYHGFAPLFDGLQPDQINQLSASLVAVLQDQAGSATRLLTQLASLTGTLANKDQVIGQLVDNLDGLLSSLHAHSGQLDQLLVQLTGLVAGLSKDRDRIGRSLDNLNALTRSASGLLRDARPDLRGTIGQLDRLAGVLNADRGMLDERLRKLPGYYQVLGRLGAYSSAFQFYLCGLQVRLDTGIGPIIRTPMVQSGARRCRY